MKNRRRRAKVKGLGVLITLSVFMGINIIMFLMKHMGEDFDPYEILTVSFVIAFGAIFGGYALLIRLVNKLRRD